MKPEASRLPTLTEVLAMQADRAEAGGVEAAVPAPSGFNDERMQSIVQAVAARLGALLEERLDDAMAPMLARLSGSVAQAVKAELLPLLRDELPGLIEAELQRPC